MPTGAIIAGGGALLGAGLSYLGSQSQADAVESATQQSTDAQRYMYDQTRADYAPYRAVGNNALMELSSLTGLGGKGAYTAPAAGTTAQPYTGQGADQTAAFDRFTASPDYQFRFDQGLDALDRSAASRGMLLSGAQVKGAEDFGQGLASTEYGNYFNRLAGLAGVGQTATAGTSAAGTSTANALSSIYGQAGQDRASIYGNMYSGINSSINSGIGLYGMYGGFGGSNNLPKSGAQY